MASSLSLTHSGRMNVLAIGSHPDDIEFGCGGTLHKMAAKGHRVTQLVLTRGSVGGDAAVRTQEQLAAAKALRVHEVIWGDFEDTRMPFSSNVIPVIEKAVKKVRPTFVFVHFGGDTHQDHRYVNECTVVASRNVPNVLFYEGPTSIDFSPNVFVDVGNHMKAKTGGLQCHLSQVMKTNIREQSIVDIARATAIFRGTQCRVPFAEAFASLRMFVLP